MKNNKLVVTLLCLILIVLSIIAVNYSFKKEIKNKQTIDSFKNNTSEEKDKPIILLLDKENKFQDVQGRGNITFISKLKSNAEAVENVAYIMEWTRDHGHISDEDITLIYKDKEVAGFKGKYEIVKESRVKDDRKYSVNVIFKKKGVYRLKIYADDYKN